MSKTGVRQTRPYKTIRQLLGEAYSAFEKLVDSTPEAEREAFRGELSGFLVLLHYRRIPLKSGKALRLAPNDESVEKRRQAIKKAKTKLDSLEVTLRTISGNRVRAALAIADARELIAEKEASLNVSGGRKLPDYERRVSKVVVLVRERTGRYHDRLVAEIIGAAAHKGYPKMPDENALRAWRFARGLKDGPKNVS